jgi:pterin-4a-carbinolamine dehydratase
MPDNPLQVIGVTADDLKDKSLDQVKALVEALGRARLRYEHPDAGGNADRFQVIRTATEKLRDQETLRAAVQELRQPARTKVAKLEQQLREAHQATNFADARAEAFMLAAGSAADWSIYHPGIVMRLRDVMRVNQSHTIKGPPVGHLFVKLHATQGQLTRSERNGVQKPRKNRLLGCLHQKDVPATFNQAIDYVLACRPTAVHHALPGKQANKAANGVGNFLSWNRAEPIRSLLRPNIGEHAIIFSYRDGDEPGLIIEGQFLDAQTADPS